MRRAILGPVFAMMLAPAALAAETKTFELTVNAGKHDRKNALVVMTLSTNERFQSVKVHNAAGRRLLAQLTGPDMHNAGRKGVPPHQLHFLLPSLPAGQSAMFRVTLGADRTASLGMAWHGDGPGRMVLRQGERPVLSYEYPTLDESSKEKRERTFKVFHHLYDSDGRRVTNGPSGKYPHHRGLFFGFNKISYGLNEKADTWHCTGDAHQSNEQANDFESGPLLGRHRAWIDWHGPGKKVFARELREVTVYVTPDGPLVQFDAQLGSTVGKVRLDGDPQHAGFHFRADSEVAAKTEKETYFLRPDGPGKPGTERNWDPKTRQGPVNLPWNAICFVLGGKRYTVAYLDLPANPKEARYSERTYGRIGSYFEYELDEKRPLNIRYRVWLKPGETTVADVTAKSADFVEPASVTVK